jgi:hypothetical protein
MGLKDDEVKILFKEIMMFLGTKDGRIWAGYDGS